MSNAKRIGAVVALYALLALFFTAIIDSAKPEPAQAGGLKFKLSKSQEKAMADDMNKELAKDPGFSTKGKHYDMVQRIGKKLVKDNALKEYEYKFYLVKQDEVNAFATPGGYVYVTQGLMDQMAYDESMLAGVMGHELGHARDRHVARQAEKKIQASLGIGLLSAVFGKKSNKTLVNALGGAAGVATLKYGRDMEEWADTAGVELTYNSGYDAYGLTRSLELLGGLYGSTSKVEEWMASHPSNDSRVKRTMEIAAETTGGKQMGYKAIPKPPKSSPLYEKYGKGNWQRPDDQPSGTKSTSPAKGTGGLKDLDK